MEYGQVTVPRFKRKEETKSDEPPAPTKEEILLAEIRDLLKMR
jgi:large conductance mechanosensitive channel